MNTGPTLVDALGAGDRRALSEMLAEDVAFHSPVRTYQGREQVVHLLVTISSVLSDLRATRRLQDGHETCTFVTARVDENDLDGLLDEIRGEDGRIVQLTLMLRPLKFLLVAVERMGQALGRNDPRSG